MAVTHLARFLSRQRARISDPRLVDKSFGHVQDTFAYADEAFGSTVDVMHGFAQDGVNT